MEDISLGMAKGDADRGEAYLDQASTRLSEARRLMERGRSGALDHESLGAVRRALNGMSHDASEGHRLLHSAYQRDGAIGPIQTLDTFSRSHRDTWSSLRDRLPVQLTDVRDEVSSVFDAIEDEVAPLQSLLPAPRARERTPDAPTPPPRTPARPGPTPPHPRPPPRSPETAPTEAPPPSPPARRAPPTPPRRTACWAAARTVCWTTSRRTASPRPPPKAAQRTGRPGRHPAPAPPGAPPRPRHRRREPQAVERKP